MIHVLAIFFLLPLLADGGRLSRGVKSEILTNDVLSMVKRHSREAPANASIEEHFLPLDQLENFLSMVERDNPKLVQIHRRGKTHEGRSLSFVQIGTCETCPAIVIEAGIHAREWLSPAVALNLIQKLVKLNRNHVYLTELTWFILPTANPDGYAFSHEKSEYRFWRKNRRPSTKSSCGAVKDGDGDGVDLNRNFDYMWGDAASWDPCDELYLGPKAASEPETQTIMEFVSANVHRIKSYVALHTYQQLFMYTCPTKEECMAKDGEVYKLAEKAVQAIKAQSEETYKVGTPQTTFGYHATGSSDQWVRYKNNVTLTYSIEMRPANSLWPWDPLEGFEVDRSQIRPTSDEMWAAFQVIADHILKKKQK